jgi:hypothetical protein
MVEWEQHLLKKQRMYGVGAAVAASNAQDGGMGGTYWSRRLGSRFDVSML